MDINGDKPDNGTQLRYRLMNYIARVTGWPAMWESELYNSSN